MNVLNHIVKSGELDEMSDQAIGELTLEELMKEYEETDPFKVLYEDEKVPDLKDDTDEHVLNGVVEIQECMAKDMVLVNANGVADPVLEDRYMAKVARYTKAKDHLNVYKEEHGSTKGYPHWKLYGDVKEDRDTARHAHMSVKAESISDLWDHWWELQEKSCGLADRHPGTWAAFFELEKLEFNLYYTWGGEDEIGLEDKVIIRNGRVAAIERVMTNPDNRVLEPGDASSLAHVEEMEQYNGPWDKRDEVPERNGGHVNYCKNMIHEYLPEEDRFWLGM